MNSRIAYISNEYPPLIYGGLGVYVDYISHELSGLGQKVSVFTVSDGLVQDYETQGNIEIFREKPISIKDGLEIFLSSQTLDWGSGLDFLLDLFSYNQLSAANVLKQEHFDLCVAHDWLGLLGGMAVKRNGIPMIYHVHGLEIGRSSNPNLQILELERKGAEVADLVITVSQAMKQEVAELGIDPHKVRVCYHGVDAEFFNPAEARPEKIRFLQSRYGLDEKDLVILFVGRLEPVKGIIQLIQAIPSVKKIHPQVKLLIVGKGNLEGLVKKAAEDQDSIILVNDFLSPEDKRDYYALADLCIFPSTYEPFGIVALEAAAMGKAAIVGARGVSGLREIVIPPGSARPTGVHVNALDPVDIAWGINLAFEDLQRLKEWGKNARQRVLQEFTWRKAAEKTLEIYWEAMR